MDPFIEHIYLGELITQCQYAFAAVQRMNTLLKAGDAPTEFFREAQDFLQHASSASRLLWPPGIGPKEIKARAETRGKHLRASLQLGDEHVLRNRRLRDHLEHYDERIDDWAQTSTHKNIVQDMIGPRSAIGGDAVKDTDIMRSYDPATKHFVFRGESFDVQAIVDGIGDVHGRAVKRHNEIDPWRRRLSGNPAR